MHAALSTYIQRDLVTRLRFHSEDDADRDGHRAPALFTFVGDGDRIAWYAVNHSQIQCYYARTLINNNNNNGAVTVVVSLIAAINTTNHHDVFVSAVATNPYEPASRHAHQSATITSRHQWRLFARHGLVLAMAAAYDLLYEGAETLMSGTDTDEPDDI